MGQGKGRVTRGRYKVGGGDIVHKDDYINKPPAAVRSIVIGTRTRASPPLAFLGAPLFAATPILSMLKSKGMVKEPSFIEYAIACLHAFFVLRPEGHLHKKDGNVLSPSNTPWGLVRFMNQNKLLFLCMIVSLCG